MQHKIYFASDFHLGVDAHTSSAIRERKIVRWLNSIEADARELYLVGDVFDHWYEYGKTVPKGYVRLLGKLAGMRDKGIPVYFFTGNHDMWMFRYFEEEFGIPIYRHPIMREIDGKKFLIGHGDGLGPGDHGYKFIKSLFANRLAQAAFRWLHPDIGLGLMKFFSVKSRQYTADESAFGPPEKEWLVQFCEGDLMSRDVDYYIFGHRHLPVYYRLSNGKSTYINLGEWMYACSYGVWDGHEMRLEFFESEFTRVYGT